MNDLQVFSSPEFGQVRTTTYNGEIAFVAKDVAERLGYTWDRNLIKNIPEEWKGVNRIHTPGGDQEMLVLTEQGLYFFLARSDKPLALPFQKWIAGEVVPSIRKHGAYLTPDKIEEVLLNPDTIIKIAMQLKEERQLRLTAESQIASDKPLVDFARQVGDCPDGKTVREMGIVFRQNGADFGQNGFVQKLLEDGYCYRDQYGNLKPYAEYTNGKHPFFWSKTTIVSTSKGTFETLTLKITGSGQRYFLSEYLPENGNLLEIA